MKTIVLRSKSTSFIRCLVATVCVTVLVPAGGVSFARHSWPPAALVAQDASRIPPEQLDSLVAPIALYPDELLSQTLVASTYPLEIMQLQQWLERNRSLKEKALVDAVSKEPWEPSIQAMAVLPDVVKRLTDDIQWTTDLGNAFLAQQSDVMDAIQRMRQKAQGTGALASNEQQTVETRVVEEKTVVVIEQSDPDVVYVPSYAPEYVYGPAVYPYPPIYYPSYPAGVVAASAISFGIGVAVGAAWGGGGWGWGCGWGNNDININNNNNFIRNTNIRGGDRTNIAGGNKWRHNPQHRGGAPYRDRATAERFGGTARGDSLANRQAGARQQIGRQGGNLSSTRAGAGGVSDRARDMGNRASSGVLGDRAGSVSDRSRNGGKGDRDRSGGLNDRARSGGLGDRSSGSRLGGGGDRVGSRDIPRSSGGGSRSIFGGGSGGFDRGSARASSSRGSSSLGGSRGGGFSRGGGMSRGGSRGGGGRRR
jgi:hypothetical protein